MLKYRRPSRTAIVASLTLIAAGLSFANPEEIRASVKPALLPEAAAGQSTPAPSPGVNERKKDAEAISLNYLHTYLAEHSSAFEAAGNDYSFKTKRVEEDPESGMHTHVQQLYRGIRVFGGEAIVHLEPEESSPSITDDLVRSVNVDTTPTLTAAEAVEIAIAKYGCSDCLTAKPTTSLWITQKPGKSGKRRDALVYRVSLRRMDGSASTALPVYFIDAHSGAVVNHYNDLQTGTGRSLYSGTKTINTFFKVINPPARTYFMEDHIRNVGIFDGASTENSVFYIVDPDNNFISANQRAGVDAHFGTSKTIDYFKSAHGRNGFDGRGGPGFYRSIDGTTSLKSVVVHYGSRFNNGFWDGRRVVLGDGDGVFNGPNVSVDWLGHEWTHALTAFTANLVYQGESGALNESMSDVFGAMIERSAYGENSNTWRLFEKTLTPRISGDAERDMASPHNGRNQIPGLSGQPDHYLERYKGTADNGGVHFNSGISNKVFHLVAKGGSHHRGGSMTGIGPDAAAKIWFRALTLHMTRTTNFKGARTATLNAARALHGLGSPQYNAVARAWSLCGVN